jgi:hypothetical protein
MQYITTLDGFTDQGVFSSHSVQESIDWLRDTGDTAEETELLSQLRAFRASVLENTDWTEWKTGLTLVCESHFPDYIRDEYAELNPEVNVKSGPMRYVDWEQYSEREQRPGYAEVEFNGVIVLHECG